MAGDATLFHWLTDLRSPYVRPASVLRKVICTGQRQGMNVWKCVSVNKGVALSKEEIKSLKRGIVALIYCTRIIQSSYSAAATC